MAWRGTNSLRCYPGAMEPVLSGLLGAANRFPRRLKEKAYAASGWAEAVAPGRLGDIRAEALAEWVTGHYPRRRYPAVFVGPSNGAMIHLAALLGAPWLPQTLLIPVRRHGGDPDEPAETLRRHRDAGQALLRANPGLDLHHMHDANQDRLMVPTCPTSGSNGGTCRPPTNGSCATSSLPAAP